MGRIGKIGREFPNELQMDDNYNRTDKQTVRHILLAAYFQLFQLAICTRFFIIPYFV